MAVARVNLAVEDVKAGLGVKEAAERHGLCTSYVRNAARQCGVEIPGLPTGPTTTASTFEILAEILNTTDTFTDIAETFGVSKQRVWEIASKARAAGIKFAERPRGGHQP